MKKTLVISGVTILLILALVIHHRNKLRSAADGGESIKTADGLTRTYVLHTPRGYSASKTYPLVLLFHGGFGTGSRVLGQTRFGQKADTEGFIVVAPNGIDNNWNDGRGTVNPDIDDVGFVRQLLASLQSRLSIDAKRIYATGVSNGGMFSERLGCELSDVLAAIGPDVGPMPTNFAPNCHPARPIPVIGIQGAADPLVPIDGGLVKTFALLGLGKGGQIESAAFTMKLWAAADRCNPDPAVTHLAPRVNDGTSVDQYTYSGCAGGSAVVYYIVQGMGHHWPPENVLPLITGPSSNNIDATDVMWAFFRAHPRQ